MTTIYLLRHGEVYNPYGILYGRLPKYRLSQTGKKEVSQTATFLKDKRIDAIYASPLLRAQQTAEIIRTTLNLPTKYISKSLLEVKTSFEGQRFASLSPDQSEVYLSSKRLRSDESIEQIAKRMHKLIEKLDELYNGQRFVLVGHGDPIMALQALVHNMPLTIPSIRTNKYFSYIKHGEVLKVLIGPDGSITIQSVFVPSL